MGTLQNNISDTLVIRVKCQKSTNIRIKADTKALLKEFTHQLEELTEVPVDSMVLLKGYPPKIIPFDRNTGTVSDLGLQSKDTLIVEFGKNVANDIDQSAKGLSVSVPPKDPVHNSKLTLSSSLNSAEAPISAVQGSRTPSQQPPSEPELSHTSGSHSTALSKTIDYGGSGNSSGTLNETYPEIPLTSAMSTTDIHNDVLIEENLPDPPNISSGLLMRHVVPADNSCLFTSVAFCLSDVVQPQSTNYLRQVIAATVASDPEKYNEAFLGRSNVDYCNWIKRPDSWGGGIEVSILSEFYCHEITVVNIQSASISRFGEDKNYSQRMLLLYDGIHYDPLYMEMFNLDENRKLFATHDMEIIQQALQLAEEAKRAHDFTDVKNFDLKCNQCNTKLKGNSEAQQHAKSTGHVDFSEII